MKVVRLCCVAAIVSLCWQAAGVYPQVRDNQVRDNTVPQLVIDSGGHTAPVTALAFTHDDKYLVSAGRDKLVRVWNLKTGLTERTIRGEIGAGQWGAIQAADLTPNDRFLAVGGQLASDDDPGGIGSVRIHEFQDQKSNGEVRAQLSGLRNVVTALTVSPKNSYVAAGDILGNVCLWRLSPPAPDTSQVACERMHQERITALAFSPDERKLVAGSWDKTLSLSAIPALKVSAVLKGHSDKVMSVAFRGEGIISSAYDGTIRQWDSGSGRQEKIHLKTADAILGNLAVDAQMRRALFCSGRNFVTCQILSLRTGDTLAKFGKHTGVTATAMSHDGSMAATAGGANSEIYVWKTDSGLQLHRLAGAGAEITAVGFARDGGSVAFSSQRAAAPNSSLLQQKIAFRSPNQSTITFRNIVERQEDYTRELHNAGGRQLRLASDDALEVVHNGTVETTIRRQPENGAYHLAFTLTPDGKFIISGGMGGFLALYDLRGNEIRRYAGHTGNITALAVSTDGKTLVSGSSDQLIKIWDLEKQTANLLGTTFVASNDEWVTWIPEGYYVSSIRGDRYAGWQINNGLKAARLVRFSDYSGIYYDPVLVAEKLGRHVSPAAAAPPAEPPAVEIGEASFKGDKLVVRAKAISQRDEISGIKIIVGGFQVPVIIPETKNPLEKIAEAEISRADWEERVQQGMISIEAEAQTRLARAASPRSTLKPPPLPGEKPPRVKARLFVLAIGISKYQNSAIDLNHPANDAQGIADFFARQKNAGFFEDVTVETLLNEKANRSQIIEKLDWLSDNPREGDLRILFLSGHGLMSRGNYYFAAHGYNDKQSPDVTSISWAVVFQRFREAAGKTLIIVDTCHAGGALNTRGLTDRQDITDMLQQFTRHGRGLATLVASTSQQLAPDDSVFFKALLKGLSGAAAGNKKAVDVLDLATFVSKQVSDLTNNRQHVLFNGLEDGGWTIAMLQ